MDPHHAGRSDSPIKPASSPKGLSQRNRQWSTTTLIGGDSHRDSKTIDLGIQLNGAPSITLKCTPAIFMQSCSNISQIVVLCRDSLYTRLYLEQEVSMLLWLLAYQTIQDTAQPVDDITAFRNGSLDDDLFSEDRRRLIVHPTDLEWRSTIEIRLIMVTMRSWSGPRSEMFQQVRPLKPSFYIRGCGPGKCNGTLCPQYQWRIVLESPTHSISTELTTSYSNGFRWVQQFICLHNHGANDWKIGYFQPVE